ncbi:MAG: hypothetical protein LBL31_04025 [Spirochaetaceae bacterium]|nr:hypothetical protein [Spirochaetaceae bacterium]
MGAANAHKYTKFTAYRKAPSCRQNTAIPHQTLPSASLAGISSSGGSSSGTLIFKNLHNVELLQNKKMLDRVFGLC